MPGGKLFGARSSEAQYAALKWTIRLSASTTATPIGIASSTASVSSEAGAIDAVMEVAVVGTSGSCAARDTRWTDRMQQYDRGGQQKGGNGLVHGCQCNGHGQQK